MKLIISQCGNQLFTCGECQIYNISTVEVPGARGGKKVGAKPLHSVGVGGISFGVFVDEQQAANVLKGIAEFLGGKNTTFKVPPCNSAAQEESPEDEETPKAEAEAKAKAEAEADEKAKAEAEAKAKAEAEAEAKAKAEAEAKAEADEKAKK